ncbi:MAG TPA: DUF2946 family protein [Vineibacter sp.]|nr:DUF2946 family protein [Vineibacter sp.]
MTPPLLATPPASAARVHVVGLLLLALLLQALSPLLHARLLSRYAAETGQPVGIAAFCLPGHGAAAPTDGTGNSPPRWPADCPLCQGGAGPSADIAAAANLVAPPPSSTARSTAAWWNDIRVAQVSAAHRPRGPPVV